MKQHKYESIIILIIVFITVFLNISVFLYRSFATPTGRVFAGTQFYSDDYAVYVSYIRQGQQGRWTVIDKFTSEVHPSSLIHAEYLFWGKLTGLFGLSPIFAYHFSRAIFGLIFLILIYLFLLKIFPNQGEGVLRIASLLLVCFSAGFLDKDRQPFLNWLMEVDPTQRFGTLMHYLLGFICPLWIFTWFFSNKRKNLLFPLILGFVSGFVLPSSLIVAATTLTIFALLNWSESQKARLAIVVLLVAGLPAFFYYRLVFHIPPWSHILAWEVVNRGPFTLIQYLLALGPISFFSPLGFLAIRRKRKLVAFLVSWITAVFLWAFFLADLLGFNPTRFLQNPVYIPMAILTVLGMEKMITIFLKKSRHRAHEHSLVLVASLLILVGLPTNIVSLRNHFQMYNDFSSLIYPEDYYIKAYKFLQKNTNPNEVVLSLYQAGNLIPFLAGNTVYLGHLQETIDYPKKVEQAEVFYSGKLTDLQAEEFLKDNRIKLVFYGPQEKFFGGKIEKYSFLETIFNNQQITIFRLKNG